MGIKLDWEIEAEQSHVRNTGEDKESQRQRRAARTRLLLLIVVVLLIFGAIAGGVALRLRQVEYDIEQRLRNTVDAEIAALRIGDRSAFLSNQRSATEDWLIAQEDVFDSYQDLKIDHDLRLTGQVLHLAIDGERARVEVEEIIDGVPYKRVWFYWDYEEGWRHVPPDYTFWGEVATLEGETVHVRYRAVDSALAGAMQGDIAGWVQQGCALLGCANLPQVTVDIVPDDGLQPGWSPANPWLLQVPSPASRRARLDTPFTSDLRAQVAELVADRLVAQAQDNMQPVPVSDAAYVRQAVVRWLSDRFAQVQTDSTFIESLVLNYGQEAVASLLQAVQPTSDISVLNQVAGTSSLDQVNVDWRDFLAWRLNLENDLITARDEANTLALYDTGDESARTIALARFNGVVPDETTMVISVTPQVDANGVAHLYTLAQSSGALTVREDEVIFRLVNGVWKRVN